jgi:hypothetical protein
MTNAFRTNPDQAPIRTAETLPLTSFGAGVDLRDTQIAARHADPRTTMRCEHAPTSTGTPTTSSPPT